VVLGAGFREAWKCFEVWSEVDSMVATRNPGVDALHDGMDVGFIVIICIRSFGD